LPFKKPTPERERHVPGKKEKTGLLPRVYSRVLPWVMVLFIKNVGQKGGPLGVPGTPACFQDLYLTRSGIMLRTQPSQETLNLVKGLYTGVKT
jgi:hypothetical protein